ncbi:MAG: DNA polymerase III subunit alpha [Gemmatimonadetes bacterium]|nr:DNA polymerase III subunit alpha [Gemmatimonadota bacterium]
MGFIHLHTHSEFSLLDGANRIPDMVSSARAMGMSALALTDHGNLFGAIHFYDACRKAGIKPLLGFEAYVAPDSRKSREGRMGNYSHLLLLAETLEGYRNLLRLSSIGYLEGFYYRPRIDREVLREHAAGIIATSACLKGEVAGHLLNDDLVRARTSAEGLASIFGERNFFLEMQDHGLAEQRRVNPGIRALAHELGLGLVCTNDVHYHRREDAAAHDVLLCIQTGKTLDDEARMRFSSDDFYFKAPEEMASLFGDVPEALANTGEIAERCNVELEFRTHLPAFPLPPDAASTDELLEREARAGLAARYTEVTTEVRERLDYELDVIRRTGYSGYFLIVQDFIRAAHERGIPVGPGRGSVGGSLVAYALGITELDPLRYGLIFERFLNPERISMPDIDIDFCYERRGEILQYVKAKYGENNVAQIITFGTMKARAAVRDVARVLQIPLAEADHIAKLIPNAPGFSMEIGEAVEKVAEIRTLFDGGGVHRRLIDNSRSLEGLSRHASVHAAGVVITPTELWNYVPLYRSEKGELTTQWDMNAVERAGLLKMDFLGLKTLTVLHYVVEDLQETLGERLDLAAIPENDPETLRMLGEGKTEGVFQFEGNVPTDVLRRMKPDSFEDLVAVNALIRPGPLDSGMTDAFIRRKRGLEPIRYPHPDLQPLLEHTYGVITYQEDVLKIAQVMAGFTLGQADVMRKAMGKKIQVLIDEQCARFIEGAVARGYDRRTAGEVADQLTTFGRYGFNRAHAVGYTVLSYRTAFLKRHYPRQYMAALLSSEMGNTDKIVRYIATSRAMGIDVLPPDINESRLRFTTVPAGIRFGLGAIKNVGYGAVESILEARAEAGPFRGLFDLCERIDLRLNNKRVLESLIMVGALDSLGGHRAQLLQVLESALGHGQRKQEEHRAGQFSLFGLGESAPALDPSMNAGQGSNGTTGAHPGGAANGSSIPSAGNGTSPRSSSLDDGLPPLPTVTPWSPAESLQKEKELIGFYVSGHPLDRFRGLMRYFSTRQVADVPDLAREIGAGGLPEVTLAGLVTNLRLMRDRKGNPMAFATLEDFSGTAECILFSEIYTASRELIASEKPLLMKGTLSTKGEDDLKVIVARLAPLEQAARQLEIRLPRLRVEAEPGLLQEVKSLLVANSGTTPVTICLTEEGSESCCRSRTLQVAVTTRLLGALGEKIGEDAIRLRAGDEWLAAETRGRRPDARRPLNGAPSRERGAPGVAAAHPAA